MEEFQSRAPGSILAILFLSYSLVAVLAYFSTDLFTIKNKNKNKNIQKKKNRITIQYLPTGNDTKGNVLCNPSIAVLLLIVLITSNSTLMNTITIIIMQLIN